MHHLKYSIVIPAHNEEARIGSTLSSYASEFPDAELIVVLNGCTDNTRVEVEKIQKAHENVHFVDIPAAIGKGGAVRAGFLVAKGAILAYVDADGSTPAREMRRLCEALGDADGAIASRWMAGARIGVRQPWMRRVASRCFNTAVRLLFGLPYADTQCGAKIFRRSAIEDIMLDVETSNLAFDVDLLVQMGARKFRVVEHPTEWVDTAGSRVRLISASVRMFAALLRLRLQRSLLSVIVPFFDKLFPTLPLRAHHKLRILIINWRDPKHPQAGGAEAYLFEQARYWVRWGHHVEWLAAGFKNGEPIETYDGIRFRRVGNKFSVYLLAPLAYLLEFRHRFDIIVDSENGIPFFTPFYSMKPKVRVVYHVHQEVFRKHLPALLAYPLMWCEAKFVPWLYRHVPLVTISEDTCAQLVGLGIQKKNIGIVHCGVDASLKPGEKSERPTAVYLGRLKPYKRVEHVVKAFARVLETVPQARLTIAGAGDARTALEELTKELNIAHAVEFEGFVSEQRKSELLARSWLSVTASEMEGWGISIIESNACGTAAVAYDVPGLREAIVNGENGLLVEEGGSLAQAMVSVLTDRELREHLERGAIARAASFSWHGAATNMLNELMQAVVGGRIKSLDLNEHWSLIDTSEPNGQGSYAFQNVLVPPAYRDEAVDARR